MILIIIVSLFCAVQLLSNSTSNDFDKAKLEVRSNYSESNSIPEISSNILSLEGVFDSQQLSFNLTGTYHKETASPQVLQAGAILNDEGISCIWLPNGENNIVGLCFSDEQKKLLVFESEVSFYVFDFSYIADRLVLTGDYGNNDTYISTFTYDEYPQNEATGFIGFGLFLNNFFANVIIPWLWEIIVSLLSMIVLYFLIFKRTSRLIRKVYTRNLRDSLFPKEHSWFGNNSPDDIYVSVRVFSKATATEYNLLDYIDKVLRGTPESYAIVGSAGEGKTFSLSRIAL